MDKKTKDAFEMVNNHLESRKKELELLVEKINRYKSSHDPEK